MKINMNDVVKVRLNTMGLKRHYDDWYEVHKSHPHVFKEYKSPKLDDEGYYSAQLWTLFKTYGDLCSLGMEVPFANCEIVLKEKLNG